MVEVVVLHQLGAGKMVGLEGFVFVAGKMVGVERAGLVAGKMVGVDGAVLAQEDVVAGKMVGVEGALLAQDMAGAMVGVVLVKVYATARRWASCMEEPASAPASADQQCHHQPQM